MDIQAIRNALDHRAALAKIEASWGAPEGSAEREKLDVLVALVESYEARRWPIESDQNFDPIGPCRGRGIRMPGTGRMRR